MSHFTPFHSTDNQLWKYNLAMCKDKYYILVGYALSKLANFARTSMLHFLIIFQEISYLFAPASSLARSWDMRGELQLVLAPQHFARSVWCLMAMCTEHALHNNITYTDTELGFLSHTTHHQDWRKFTDICLTTTVHQINSTLLSSK